MMDSTAGLIVASGLLIVVFTLAVLAVCISTGLPP